LYKNKFQEKSKEIYMKNSLFPIKDDDEVEIKKNMMILPYSLKKSSIRYNKNAITNLLLTVLHDVDSTIKWMLEKKLICSSMFCKK
jgi:hypothetical protein